MDVWIGLADPLFGQFLPHPTMPAKKSPAQDATPRRSTRHTTPAPHATDAGDTAIPNTSVASEVASILQMAPSSLFASQGSLLSAGAPPQEPSPEPRESSGLSSSVDPTGHTASSVPAPPGDTEAMDEDNAMDDAADPLGDAPADPPAAGPIVGPPVAANLPGSTQATEERDAELFVGPTDAELDAVTSDRSVEYFHYRIHPASSTREILVPFDDLGDPRERGKAVPPSTARWRFTTRFPASQEDEAFAVFQQQLRLQLPRYQPNEAPLVGFPVSRANEAMVDVTFRKQDHFRRAQRIRLRFNGHSLEPLFLGAPMPVDSYSLGVEGLPASAPVHACYQATANGLRPYGHVREAWAIEREVEGSIGRTFAGRLRLLFQRAPDIGIHELPGYILFEGESYRLVYRGRLDHCTRCKGRATRLHTFADCPRKVCNICNRQGHYAAECHEVPPDHTTAQDSQDLDYGPPEHN